MTRTTNCVVALTFILAGVLTQAHAQLNPVNPGGGLVGPGNAMGDQSASAVWIDGTSAILGAQYDDDLGDSSGTAAMFRFNGSSWVLDGQLLPNDGAAYDRFGASVAVSGNWALVGAPMFEDVGVSPYPDIGAVYVFKRNNGIWQQTQRLFTTNPRTNDQFGLAIAISGTVAVCSTTKDAGGTVQGAAYVYRFNGSTWVMEQKLVAAGGGTYTFGGSVAIQGNRVVVGAPNETNAGNLFSGAAYVYDYNGSSWQQKQRLVPSDPFASDSFGYSVAVDNDSIAIGAVGDDDRGSASGSVYVFRLSGSTWVQSQKLLASDGTASDQFGFSTSMSQGTLLIGAKDKYGPPLYTGAAYAYSKVSTTYVFDNRLVLPTVTNSDNFGAAVCTAGNIAIVGAPGSDFTAFNGGRAWLYSSSVAPNNPPTLTVSSPANNSSYPQGQSVSFSASASDIEDGAVTSSIQWTSNLQNPSLIGTGGSFTKSNLVVGTHAITVSVTDSDGSTTTIVRNVTITGSSNTAPVVTISSPANNSSYTSGSTVTFSATASDAQDGNLTSSLVWTSNISGQIGLGGSFTKNNLVVGTHTITASVTDSGGLPGSAVRTITITSLPSNTPPTVTVTSPANNASYTFGATVTFSGSASDAQDGNLTSSLLWISSLQGQLGFGGSFSRNDLSTGTHTITARVTDSGGLVTTATRTITITAPPVNTPPTVTISSPVNNFSGTVNVPITFSATASDAQDGNISSGIVWTSNIQGQFGVGASFSYSALSQGTHTITARSTDSGGLQGTATRTVTILPPPVDTTASSQTAKDGTVTGSYTLTQSSNLQYQAIQEKESNGTPSSRFSFLEHTWTFSNVPTGGTTRAFHIKAYHSPSTDGDHFVFAYTTSSANNAVWTNMATVTQTTDSGTYLIATLPANLSGTVYVRVKDTDQVAGHKELNTIYIDHMFIRKQ